MFKKVCNLQFSVKQSKSYTRIFSKGDQDVRPSPCAKDCGWPMCSNENCKVKRADHEAECKISVGRGGVSIKNFGQDHPMYQAIGILRAVALRENNPEAYEQLLKLQSNVDKQEAQQSGGLLADLGMVVNLIRNFFKLTSADVSDEVVAKISGIIETNGHEIPLPGNYGQLNRRLIGQLL